MRFPCKANIRRTTARLGIGLASPDGLGPFAGWSQIASSIAHTCLASYQRTRNLTRLSMQGAAGGRGVRASI